MRRVPAILAAVLLAAHFFRAGHLVLTLVCLLLPALFFPSSRAARLASKGLLLAGAGIWMFNAGWIGHARAAARQPWTRMAVILIGVALFTALAAWLLPGPPERTRGGAERSGAPSIVP